VLLVAAGLLLRTLANLRQLDLGFRPDNVLTLRTTLPRDKYSDPQRREAFYQRVITGVRALPGVTGAAYASNVPFQTLGNTNGYRIDSGVDNPEAVRDALFRVATGDYLRTLGVELVAGRLFGDHDGGSAPAVVVVNETLARRHWPDGTAVGHRITFSPPDREPKWYTIVGVVRDVRERGYIREMKPGVYLPFAQALDTWALPETLVVRSADPAALTSAVRRTIVDADPEQPVSAMRTLQEVVDLDVADRHQQLTLIGAFAALAVLLASIGLYGLLAYRVAERRREIGVRMALGATRGRILRSVVRQGLTLTGAGVGAGLVLALAATRTLQALLYGVRSTDPRTLAAAAGLFVLVGVTASALPAMRAARVDPIRALRDE
jgi:predicted permease